jgi:hypothetical protein
MVAGAVKMTAEEVESFFNSNRDQVHRPEPRDIHPGEAERRRGTWVRAFQADLAFGRAALAGCARPFAFFSILGLARCSAAGCAAPPNL